MHSRKLIRQAAAAAGIAAVAAALAIAPTLPAAAAADLGDAWTDKSRYAPGETVTVTAEVSGTGPVDFSLVHLGAVVASGTVQATGDGEVDWAVTPPAQDFTGYLVHVDASDESTQTAVDVSSDWTRYPRTGYLDTYAADLPAAERQEIVQDLSRKYHLNSLQFYDWMWRHEKPIERDVDGDLVPTWTAWNGDVIAPDTVSGFIDAAHDENIAALPYSMSYAALEGFTAHGVDEDWRLTYRSDGSDWKFQMLPNRPDTTLWLMNPENPGWEGHITAQYADQISTMGFDGTHIDQLGNWGGAPDGGMDDILGDPVDLPGGFADLIDTTRDVTGRLAGFNAVDGFGAEAIAGSSSEYLYTELWENHETYAQVADYLDSQRAYSGGKGALVAAYLNYRINTGTSYEAEDGQLAGGVAVDDDHLGYTGTGFLDNFGATGDSVTVTVTVPESRRYGIVPRWSNGTGATVTRTVAVDGAEAGQIKLTPTADWDTWNTEGGTAAFLSAGTHTIELSVESGDTGYANLDSITLGTFDTPSVQLANAAFAANGASHIEMGQGDQMLVAPYFLDETKQMSHELQAWMESYYDVITGYENVLYGPTLRRLDNIVEIAGHQTSTNGAGGTIWTNVMRNDGRDVIHLLNLEGNDGQWRNPAADPATLTDVPVKYYLGDSPTPEAVHVASPDRDGGRATELPFTQGSDAGGAYISFVVPSLTNWDIVYMGESTVGNGNVVTKAAHCLDVAGGSTANGTAIQLWSCADVPAQDWTFENGQLKALGRCLDLEAGGTSNGTLAHLWDCNTSPSQQWERTAHSQYHNAASGRCLDADGEGTADGTRVHIWDCHTGPSQKWTLPR
ncbi:glycoside hydrolase family 66 protein [Microbacterium karelineae]|uniref:glycoside hydrolase family 66 protein n=1 Tax=Microbacterium karelineae TaxID=2654283 RepID=UPI0018D2E67F|nr:glycoside hydrolase family 66 protein [Microbacterium karelineae]